LHRRILLSRTYRQSSIADLKFRITDPKDSPQAMDPEDRLLWHFPRRRLEGEAVRDAMLACAGTLNPTPFGPPLAPPLGKDELTGLFDAKGKWKVTKDPAEHARRGVYLLERRTFLYPLFAAFDPPEVMASCPRRQTTIVPTQALALLNSPVAREQAAAFARRLEAECGPASGVASAPRVVDRAWRLAFGRPATPAEAERAVRFLRERGGEAGLVDLCLALFNANEFVYLD